MKTSHLSIPNFTKAKRLSCIFPGVENFVDWLDAQLENRNWSYAELARQAGVNQSSLSMIRSGQRNVGNDLCEAIARAFKLPKDVVLRAAGILPEEPTVDVVTKTIVHLVQALPTDDRREILEYVKLRVRLAEERENDANKGNPTKQRKTTESR